jgi:iron complex outermembrane recepter protein
MASCSTTGRVFVASALTTALVACLPPRALAQQADPQQLPAVHVTGKADKEKADHPVSGYVATRSSAGSKTDTALIDNPQSVTVITRDQMDAQGVQTLDQAVRYVPAASSQDDDLRFDQLSIRGFDADSYLDGMKLNRTTWFANPRIDPYFLERIDVLRGPASVLYGQASPGGVVDMVSKQPTADPLHSVELSIGNYDRRQLGFDFGGPIDANGQWLYRVTGLARDSDTQTDHIGDERFGIAPALTWRPNEATSLTLLSSFQRDPQGGLFNPLPAYGTVLYNPNGKISPSEYLGDSRRDHFARTQYSVGYLFEHQFNDHLQVRQNLRYLHDDVNYYQTSLSSLLNADQRTGYVWANINKEHMGQVTLDNQVQADFSTGWLQHTVLVGLDYQYLYSHIHRGGEYFGATAIDIYDPDYSAIPTVPVTLNEATHLSQLGSYFQDQVCLDRWLLTLGGRFDWARTVDTQQSATTGEVSSYTDQRDHAFTWRAGLNYKFDNGIAPYLSYSTSFQPQTGNDWSGKAFVPTLGEQYEMGVKYQPVGMRAYITAAWYDLKETNVLTADPTHVNYEVQTGEIRSRGIEIEAHAELTKNLSVLASYSNLDQTVLRSNDGDQGKHPVSQPIQMTSAWGDYTIDGGVWDKLGFGMGVRYVGKSYGSADNTLVVPGHTLVDVAAHYSYGKWLFGLNANNLFNKTYVSYCSSYMFCYYGAKLTVMATARYQW